jgi:hypothetical protein
LRGLMKQEELDICSTVTHAWLWEQRIIAHTSTCYEAGNVVVVEPINALEVPIEGISKYPEDGELVMHTSVHSPIALPPRYPSCCGR